MIIRDLAIAGINGGGVDSTHGRCCRRQIV
jgi:hypothetical protein